jgi:hypothetical protein
MRSISLSPPGLEFPQHVVDVETPMGSHEEGPPEPDTRVTQAGHSFLTPRLHRAPHIGRAHGDDGVLHIFGQFEG